ncbi:HEAT repeat domain-containing protein, partial [Myxococcota bacterium]|nr:HEAT repeat domain-containing protein [Myxococcota bacterium]
EDETEVALRVFDLLVSSGLDGRFVYRAIDVAMRSREPRLEIRGAARSGDAGRPILRRYAGDPTLHDRVRAEALRGLAGSAAFTSAELVVWLGAAGPLFTEVIAESLGALDRGDGLEDALLSLAAHHGERVRITAIRALARHGDAKAFTFLSGLTADPSTPRAEKVAALSSLEAVGARVEGSGAGQLSLVDDRVERGHVSLAPAEQGALSFDPDDR